MYRVVGWADHFENNRTKELKHLSWVPFPNKHDGDGYTELLFHPQGAAHYGAWCAIVQVASKCDPRGTLMRDGARPHTAASLSRMTKVPEAIMQDAIERLVNPIGWLEVVPDPVATHVVTEMSQEGAMPSQRDAVAPQESALNGSEGKRLEGNHSLSDRKASGSALSIGQSLRQSRKDFSSRGGRRLADLSHVDWSHVVAMAEAVGKRVPPLSDDDRRMWLQFGVLADTAFDESWLVGGADAVVNAKETKRTRQAHLVGVLKARAADRGTDGDSFSALMDMVEIPDDVWGSEVLR